MRGLVYEIAETIKIRPNFLICRTDLEAIAAASFRNNQGHIIYDARTFRGMRLAGQRTWGAIAILAHEISHILSNDFYQKPSKEIQLKADHFAGFVLGKMGASESETIHLFEQIGTREQTVTHGSKEERVESARRGWVKAYVGLQFSNDLSPFFDYAKLYGLRAFHFINTFLGLIATAGGATAAISGMIVWWRRRKKRQRAS